MKHKLLANKFKIVGFLGYFLILLLERVLALIFSFNHGEEYALSSNWFFPYVTYIVTAISVLAGVILFIKPVFGMLKALFSKAEYDFKKNNKLVTIASMVFLVSGMMHTGFTVPGIQFTAYGFLILAMLIRVIESCHEENNKFVAIISFIYLVLFSMTIPVCYRTNLTNIYGTLFYVFEFLAVGVLIPLFGIMLYQYFDKGVCKFQISFLLAMLVLDGLMIGFKFSDEVNMFVLIFAVCTLIAYLIKAIVCFCKKN